MSRPSWSPAPEPIFDLKGKELKVADKIIVAMPNGNTANLQIGHIVEINFHPNGKVKNIKVLWENKNTVARLFTNGYHKNRVLVVE